MASSSMAARNFARMSGFTLTDTTRASMVDSFLMLASNGGAPAPRRPAARTAHLMLASNGGAPAPRRPAARTAHLMLASNGGAPAPRRPEARGTHYASSGMTQRGARPAATRWMLSKPLRKRAVQFSQVGPAECGVRVTLGRLKSG